ncbi:MAG: hypothetical protein KF718_10980 [Polyangiaceae bacterium]|nr:hypothetical protein [Polyangiaceae bacterium]
MAHGQPRGSFTPPAFGQRRPWAELVFHVLAHVRGGRDQPASVWEPRYVAWVAGLAGKAESRCLGQDARLLGQVARHQAMAALQLMAWLFDGVEQAEAVACRDIAQLGAREVAAPELLGPLAELGPLSEVLRAAALLEREVVDALPPPAPRLDELADRLVALAKVAPELEQSVVCCVRPLWLRGRVRGSEIWVGCPEADRGPTPEHVAWQAAHEATVHEVGRRSRHLGAALTERVGEQVALTLLKTRAAARGLQREHARWLGHFGSLPPLGRDALGQDARAVFDSLGDV